MSSPERPTVPPRIRSAGGPASAAEASLRGAAPDAGSVAITISSNPPLRQAISSLPPAGFGDNSPLTLPAICSYGRFELLGRLAFGGMAEIFLAREATSVGTARLIAIKRILPRVAGEPEFVRMFLDEARLAIQLHHPAICHLYEFGELEGTYFIAMEWIHGAQLGKLIRAARAHGGVPPEIAARIVANVAEALHYAHRLRDASGTPLGIVHRDVSPHNVMVGYDGHVKLLDFGIAKAVSQQTKTEAGVVKGKFAYMAPEQCLGQAVDARSDVFALGICLYEVLTGEALYRRATDYETMRAVIEGDVPSVRTLRPALPPELDVIVQKALAKEPDERWKSAGAMHDALEEWLAKRGEAVTARNVSALMAKLFEDQIRAGPLVDSTPFGASVLQRAPSADPGPSAASPTQVEPLSGVVSAAASPAPSWGSIDLPGASDPPPAPPSSTAHGAPPRPAVPPGPRAPADDAVAAVTIEPATQVAARPAALTPELFGLADAPAESDDVSARAAPVPERSRPDASALDLAFDPRAPAQRPRPRPRSVPELHPPTTASAGLPQKLAELPAWQRWALLALALVAVVAALGIGYRLAARALRTAPAASTEAAPG